MVLETDTDRIDSKNGIGGRTKIDDISGVEVGKSMMVKDSNIRFVWRFVLVALALSLGSAAVRAQPSSAAATSISINGIRLGSPLSAFVANVKGYRCMENASGRIAVCGVLMERLNKCVVSPSGLKSCGVSVETADPALMDVWRYWYGAQMQEGATILRFIDGRLVYIEMKPANSESESLIMGVNRLLGPPDKIRPAAWRREMEGRTVGLSISYHDSDSYIILNDPVLHDEWIKVYREERIDESRIIRR